MSRSPALHVAHRLGLTFLLALLVTAVDLSLPARGSAAALTSTEIAIADPPSDAKSTTGTSTVASYQPEFDIVSASIVQDRPASQIRATVTFAGPSTGGAAILHIALGLPSPSGDCNDLAYGDGTPDATTYPRYVLGGSLHLETMVGDDPIPGPPAATAPVPGFFILGAPAPIVGTLTKARVGNTITLTTPVSPYFASRGWDCADVVVEQRSASGFQTVDIATGFAPKDATPAPLAGPTPIGNATAQIIDADGDGIPDITDVCPQVAGAATNGCPSTPLARSVVLGTGRVKLDRLIPLTGKRCPAAATVTAVLHGRVVGRGQIGVLGHSKWCQVRGVLKLKKRVAKARVTVKGTGMAPFAITVSK